MTKKLEPGMNLKLSIEKTDFDYEVQVNLSMFNTK
jgi:hypothetical protein